MSTQFAWLPCLMQKGMFTDEYAVQIHITGGTAVSLFAHKTLVAQNGSATSGYLRTNLIRKEKINSTVLLPTEPFETGSRWATVPSSDVHPKPLHDPK